MNAQLRAWAAALGGEVSGRGVNCPGPGHGARDRSLSVTPSATAPNGFLANSFAGDDPIACLDHVRAKLGLPEFSPRPPQKPAAATSNGDAKRVLINTLIYTYRNPQGEKIYCKERYEYSDGSKSFAIKPAGRNGSLPLLYGCERLADLGAGDPVWIVEGEKKVERLRQLGATAVCCDSGANSKWLPQHAELLRGLPIILWPDSDDAGIQYTASAAAAIHERDPVADIRVVSPFPVDGGKGRDVIDWAAAGGTPEQLHALIENDARQWEPSGQHDTIKVNSEAFYRERPQSREQGRPITLPPPPDRTGLILSAWLDRDIPPRDYLLGSVMCTTSRWFVIGETGIGKTLFAGAMGGAVAKGSAFLNWEARRPARVMFVDGELPVETFKERMELIAARYGRDIPFYGYNREDLGFDGLPPLNTPAGQAWLWREIEAIKPDLILFDSIMCLLAGSMVEEATWAPMKPLVCELSARHIAQVWFNHANDLGKSFGDKTREWEMDTVAKLSKVEGDDETAIQLEFSKARLRTPKTAGQFAPVIIRPADDWHFEIAKAASGGKLGGDAEMVRDEFVKVYDHLADSSTKSLGLDHNSSVFKVSTAAIRDELRDRGFLDADENGAISRVSRNHFSRAKKLLLRRGTFAERKGHIWRL